MMTHTLTPTRATYRYFKRMTVMFRVKADRVEYRRVDGAWLPSVRFGLVDLIADDRAKEVEASK